MATQADGGVSDTPNLDGLPDYDQKARCAPQKGLPPVLEKKERKRTKDQLAKDFRDAVWVRDKAKSRATGRKMVKSGTTDWAQLGEVDHTIPRSLAPERIYDVQNGLLLSKEENRLRKVCCPQAPEHRMFDYTGPDDRGEPQTFVWRDKDGAIKKQRIG